MSPQTRPSLTPWVSPELTLRPSLSGSDGDVGRCATSGRVAGANAPAFVERIPSEPIRSVRLAVSPELTLRPSLSDHRAGRAGGLAVVSPELTLRPLLSAQGCVRAGDGRRCVAGANAPAFVERPEADARQLGVNCVAGGRCCMIQLRREWGLFSNFSFRTPQRRISAYPARPSG